ncbi:Tyrosine kinase family catalytic domain protein [Penicillium capsulatum]|uniref:Tyrosine kinase family catalytic domain protein n=1 Tax=Penicillium capsulatum TaxID=69766 RepID=A0A9W9LK26_9EURO|nr:Tyrosine kinase family catalytic domain protein [Penicillium capsulatum]
MACHTGLGRGSLPGRLLRLVFLISVWILGGYGAPSHLIPEPYNPIDKTIASLDKPRWQNAPPALVHRDSNNAQVDCWYLGQRYMDGMTMVSYGSRDHYTDGNIAIGCLRGSGYSGIISSAIVYEFDQKIIPPVTEPEDNRDTGGPTKNQIAKVTTDTTLYNVVPIMEKLTPDGSGLRGAAVKVHKAFQLAPNDVERIYKDLVPKGSDEDDSDDESGHGSFLLLEELDENGADLMKSFDSGNPGFDRFSMIDHLVRGITYAHQHGIFHGDIILANLMSTGQPDDWRIIDWDAAQEHPNLKGKIENPTIHIQTGSSPVPY